MYEITTSWKITNLHEISNVMCRSCGVNIPEAVTPFSRSWDVSLDLGGVRSNP